MIRSIVVTVAVISLSGCATMNRSECETADWQAIGYEDGAGGRVLSYLSNHRKACAEYGVTPEMAPYEQGRQAGLREYCVPANGYSLGKAGKSLNRVCPGSLAGDFEGAWQEGREVYRADSQQRSSKRALQRQQQQLRVLEARIAEAEKELVSDGVSSQRRKTLLSDIKKLNAELITAVARLPALEDQLALDQQNAERIRSRYEY